MHSQEGTEKIALFDMDGTLFNYQDRMKEELEKMRGPTEPPIDDPFEDQTHLEFRRKAIKRVPGFWKSLPRYQPGWDVLEMAKEIGFQIHILTKGPSSVGIAWMEKMECIKEHFKGEDVTLHVTEDKSVTYGRVLVDDFEDYVTGWLHWRCRGLAIMPEHPYNKDFKHPNVVHYYGGDMNKQEVRQALQAAFEREAKQHWRDCLRLAPLT